MEGPEINIISSQLCSPNLLRTVIINKVDGAKPLNGAISYIHRIYLIIAGNVSFFCPLLRKQETWQVMEKELHFGHKFLGPYSR